MTRALIVFSLQIIAPDETRTILLRTLAAMLGPTRVAPGCLEAGLYSDLDRRKTLLLVEDWDTLEQFECNLDGAKVSNESVRWDERNDQYADKTNAHRLAVIVGFGGFYLDLG
jgi:quinol monooxygenase YgiN